MWHADNQAPRRGAADNSAGARKSFGIAKFTYTRGGSSLRSSPRGRAKLTSWATITRKDTIRLSMVMVDELDRKPPAAVEERAPPRLSNRSETKSTKARLKGPREAEWR